MFGRGIGYKSSDWAVAFLCHQAHLDLDKFDRYTKQAEWLAAFVRTQDYIWTNKLVKVST